MKTRKRFNLKQSRKRGSALISAVLFSFVVVTLMGSYLYLSTGEHRHAVRSYLFGLSFNLAEGGIDRALHVLEKDDNSGWRTGTASDGRTYWAREFGEYDLGSNIYGKIRVVILDPKGTTPEVYSEGESYGRVLGGVKKQLHVRLSRGFYPFLNGFNSERGILLKGNNVTFDSYDSRNGTYGFGNINSDITVSTVSVETDAVDIGNADIYGYVATGAAEPDVGPKGSITEYGNPGVVDKSRITTDFYASFPNADAPTLDTPITTIPSSGTLLTGDYEVSSWSMAGNNHLTISGDVRIHVKEDISITGKAQITVTAGSSLEVYVKGDADIRGNGILNANQTPQDLLLVGINETEGGQEISISGNGYLSAAVYAPNANVTLSGGGSDGRVFGAVAAYDAKLSGNSHFSYDEALEEYNLGAGGYQVEEWLELSGPVLAAQQVNMSDFGF